jgi:predicted transcriptional regulator
MIRHFGAVLLPALPRWHVLSPRPSCLHQWPEVRTLREFGDLEMAIMEVMWASDGPHVVREVRERLRYRRPVAYTTVMTVMSILHCKGVLDREKLGRAWRYWPVEAREEHDARLMAEVLRSGGDEDVTMRRFLERVSDDEMRSLCGALAAARSRPRGVPEACRPAGSARGRGTGRIRTPTRT